MQIIGCEKLSFKISINAYSSSYIVMVGYNYLFAQKFFFFGIKRISNKL